MRTHYGVDIVNAKTLSVVSVILFVLVGYLVYDQFFASETVPPSQAEQVDSANVDRLQGELAAALAKAVEAEADVVAKANALLEMREVCENLKVELVMATSENVRLKKQLDELNQKYQQAMVSKNLDGALKGAEKVKEERDGGVVTADDVKKSEEERVPAGGTGAETGEPPMREEIQDGGGDEARTLSPIDPARKITPAEAIEYKKYDSR